MFEERMNRIAWDGYLRKVQAAGQRSESQGLLVSPGKQPKSAIALEEVTGVAETASSADVAFE